MSISKLKEVIGDNEEAIGIVSEIEKVQASLTDRVSFLEKDSKTAFEKRDHAVGELKTALEKLGIEDFSDESLSRLKKGGDSSAEVENIKKQLEEAINTKSQLENEYMSYKQTVALESAIAEAGVAAEVANPEMFKIVKNLLQSGATINDDGTVGYKNPDGTTMYVDGKPLTLSDRVNQLASDEAYAGLFKPRGVGGSGSKGSKGGSQSPNVDLSKLSHAEKGQLMKELGHDGYLALVKSQKK